MRALTTAAVIVAFATPAMAFDAAPQDPPLGSGIYLTCKPPLDRSDRDPVVSTMVGVAFLSDTNHHVKSFDVIHNLFSGHTINRPPQSMPLDFSYGSLASLSRCLHNVGLSPNTGHITAPH
jgi:hypothetical protein